MMENETKLRRRGGALHGLKIHRLTLKAQRWRGCGGGAKSRVTVCLIKTRDVWFSLEKQTPEKDRKRFQKYDGSEQLFHSNSGKLLKSNWHYCSTSQWTVQLRQIATTCVQIWMFYLNSDSKNKSALYKRPLSPEGFLPDEPDDALLMGTTAEPSSSACSTDSFSCVVYGPHLLRLGWRAESSASVHSTASHSCSSFTRSGRLIRKIKNTDRQTVFWLASHANDKQRLRLFSFMQRKLLIIITNKIK